MRQEKNYHEGKEEDKKKKEKHDECDGESVLVVDEVKCPTFLSKVFLFFIILR